MKSIIILGRAFEVIHSHRGKTHGSSAVSLEAAYCGRYLNALRHNAIESHPHDSVAIIRGFRKPAARPHRLDQHIRPYGQFNNPQTLDAGYRRPCSVVGRYVEHLFVMFPRMTDNGRLDPVITGKGRREFPPRRHSSPQKLDVRLHTGELKRVRAMVGGKLQTSHEKRA